jgi:stage II sporulation protein D
VDNQVYAGNLLVHIEDNQLKVVHEELRDEIARSQEDHAIGLSEHTLLDDLADQEVITDAHHTRKDRTYFLRVLLAQEEAVGGTEWSVQCPAGFVMYDLHHTRKKVESSKSEITVRSTESALYINGKKCSSDQVCIVPKKDHVQFGGQAYEGVFLVTLYKGKRLLINALNLEDYVVSVLMTESWPGWPLEVNKVFAIASRSYALAMVMRSRVSKLPYHIKNTNVHQTYSGVHTNNALRRAVEQTRGVFLAYDNKPIIAMFDSCCGGVIPAGISDFNFSKAPYLARKYACTACKNCSLYEWQAEYTLADLTAYLRSDIPVRDTIKQIKIVKKDAAGLVMQLLIKGARGQAKISGKRIYSALKGVKSFCFTVTQKPNTVLFKGRGYGHHLGLCQWGARQKVREGKGYRDILLFYYPGTLFMKLE